jgi:hypothetical protein
MSMRTKIVVWLLGMVVLHLSCNRGGRDEIHVKGYSKVVNYNDRIVDIVTDRFYKSAHMYLLDDYFIMTAGGFSYESAFDIYNKNTFEWVASGGMLGKGSGEVTSPGRLAIESVNKVIWVSDHGKRLLWKFPLDSVLNNSRFMPSESLDHYHELFLERFGFINDTIALGRAVRVINNSTFEMTTAKLDFRENSTEAFGYEHPEAINRLSNAMFNFSLSNQMYVTAYLYLDLLSFCNMDGSLLFNIYGPDYKKYKDGEKSYYHGVDFMGEYVVVSYNGDDRLINLYGDLRGNTPSRLIVFNTRGKYLKTIEVGNKIERFVIDEENRRIIAFFLDRENPLGYFPLDL